MLILRQENHGDQGEQQNKRNNEGFGSTEESMETDGSVLRGINQNT